MPIAIYQHEMQRKLQDIRVHSALRPQDKELTQLTPVRCHRAGLLDGMSSATNEESS
jgi:hypothetical protein